MQSSQQSLVRLWLWVVFAAALCVKVIIVIAEGPVIESNILKLLPQDEADPYSEKAFQSFSEKNMQQIVFLVAHANETLAQTAAKDLLDLLNENSNVGKAYSGMTANDREESGRLTFEYRHQLQTQNDRLKLDRLETESFADYSIRQLYSPVSGGLIELLQVDPFLLSFRASTQLSTEVSALNYKDGLISVNRQGKYYFLVLASLSKSAFSPAVQDSLSSDISRWQIRWAEKDPTIQLLRSGALFYALHGFQTAQREISTIGLGSLCGVIALILLTFRNLKPLLMVVLTVLVGITTGFVIVHQLFGEIHLLTLVFGASLIGVAVDYAFHYLTSDRGKGNFAALRKIMPAVSLGLISSVIGYLALLTTPFPGLKQMAIFCVCGLLGAYLTVVLFLPYIKQQSTIAPTLVHLSEKIMTLGNSQVAKRVWWVALLIPISALYLISTQTNVAEDIRQFQSPDQQLLIQQEQIQSIMQTPAANQFYLVKAETVETLLQKLEALDRKLETLVEQGVIAGYQTLTHWLPSEKRQRANYELYTRLYHSQGLEQIAQSGIFDETEVQRIRNEFEHHRTRILTLDEWLNSPIGESLNYLWLGKIDDQYVSLVSLRGINDLEPLASVDAELVFVDKVAKISTLFHQYKSNAVILLVFAIALIFLILIFRLGIGKAILVISSPLIAISMSLIMLSLFAIPLTLFNTLALFLVLGIGVDYGVFFAESKKIEGRILLAVFLSALTTIFSFGLLSLSQTPAIFAFGFTMLTGICTAFLLSPLVGNLLHRTRII